ncbi:MULTISPECIES: hypothetical protein [unclassified Rhizobium]|uniref:hypothetical protein n=1 Tax=unclassified Rhizobium TaxID=2613769 RepID=UPI0038175401
MLRAIAMLVKKVWPFLLAGVLTALMIIVYKMGELVERHHPKLMENVHYAIAAIILFVSFYFIVLLIQTVWTTVHDDDDQ